jgi:hypothetical protein
MPTNTILRVRDNRPLPSVNANVTSVIAPDSGGLTTQYSRPKVTPFRRPDVPDVSGLHHVGHRSSRVLDGTMLLPRIPVGCR